MKLLLVTIVFVGFLSGVSAEISFGKCNMTFISHGARICQRGAAENLKLVKDSTCKSEFIKTETECLKRHVKSCDPLFNPLLVDLFKHVLLSCGKETDIALPNDVIFSLLNCTSAKPNFSQAKNCWNNFANKVKANKNDSSLCSVYRHAKRCAFNQINTACPEVALELDHCNPFCANGTDDHRECPALPISLICDRHTIFAKEKVICERKFIGGLTSSGGSSCSIEVPKLVSCVKDQYKECFFPRVDNTLLEKLEDAIIRTSSGQRLFCNATPLDVSVLPLTLRDIVGCNAQFYTDAEKCVTGFRGKYSSKKDNDTLCRSLDAAKVCLYKAQVKHCQHSPYLLRIFNETLNPFTCQPTGGSEMRTWSGWVILGAILFYVYNMMG